MKVIAKETVKINSALDDRNDFMIDGSHNTIFKEEKEYPAFKLSESETICVIDENGDQREFIDTYDAGNLESIHKYFIISYSRETPVIKIKYHSQDQKRLKVNPKGNLIDMYSAEKVVLTKNQFHELFLGVAMELPKGYMAELLPRSSMTKNFKVIQVNSPGQIDDTYCGDNDWWKLPIIATEDTVINVGDKVAQFKLVEIPPVPGFIEVESLGNKDRGGCGSTGKK